MKTVLIADDEYAIRDGLKYIIDWEELGFEICGEASNGEDTLSKILTIDPDLVLLDMKMPKLHGIEVIQRSRDAGFSGKFIILSGFSDFKYAQEAMKNGVSFYLTKPIDEDDLYAAVSKIHESLEEENSRFKRIRNLQKKAKHVLLEELLTDAVSLSEQELSELPLDSDIFQVVLCEDFTHESQLAPYSFADLLRVVNKENSIFEHIRIKSHDTVILKDRFGIQKLNDFLQHFDDLNLQKGSPMASMFLTIGRPVSSPQDLSLSYKDALTLLQRRYFCPQNQHYLTYETLPSLRLNECTAELDEALSKKFCEQFTDCIKTFNRKQMAATLSELETHMNRVSVSVESIRLFLTDLYLLIRETITHTYPSMDIPFRNNGTVIQEIYHHKYLFETIQYLSEQFEMIMNATGNPSRDTILNDVLYYIDHNFRTNIKLDTIAPLFGYNSAYLGKIFSKTVGESFNSYIDHKRISFSVKLLEESNWKVYEIAEHVGYKNVDYFHKKFKKYMNISPIEYRKQLED